MSVSSGERSRRVFAWGAVGLAALLVALGGLYHLTRPRPSFLIFVYDTTRADAVSAYGEVYGTTPAFDALASEGVLYTRAYANASWTLPSHATLFTGLLPHQHGVTWKRTTAPDELVTLAERLSDAGYETAGFAENAWVSSRFNLNQGFEYFKLVPTGSAKALPRALARWLEKRDPERPFFLFVNVVDAHSPYEVRDTNPFLPPNVDAARARKIPQNKKIYMCRPAGKRVAALRGLYLGGVHAADAQLARTLEALGAAGLRDSLVTIVTSDHGEQFGERGYFQHVMGVREPLIHVPLVVHGMPGGGPRIVDSSVQLASVTPSVLEWAGLDRPAEIDARVLPLRAGAPEDSIVAEYFDPNSRHEKDQVDFINVHRMVQAKARANCRDVDRAFGEMRALIRYPYKLLWYERFPSELFDLSVPENERVDLAAEQPERLAELEAELAAAASRPGPELGKPPDDQAPLPEDVEAGLRALGYLEESDAPPANSGE